MTLKDIKNEAELDPDNAFDDLVETYPDVSVDYPLGADKSVEAIGVLLDPNGDVDHVPSQMKVECKKLYHSNNNVVADWSDYTVRPLTTKDVDALVDSYSAEVANK